MAQHSSSMTNDKAETSNKARPFQGFARYAAEMDRLNQWVTIKADRVYRPLEGLAPASPKEVTKAVYKPSFLK